MSHIASISYAYFSSICYNDEKNYKQVATVGPAVDEREAFKQICEFIASVENDQVFDEQFSREVLAIAETGDSAQLEQIVKEHEPIRCQFFVWSTTKLPLVLQLDQEEQEEEQETPLSKKRKMEVVLVTKSTSSDSDDDKSLDQNFPDQTDDDIKMWLVGLVQFCVDNWNEQDQEAKRLATDKAQLG